MIDQRSLGQRILERRKARGLTQEQLGIELGVTPQAVSRWENGESAPDIGSVPDLCRVLGVSADTLLGVDLYMGIEPLSKELAQRIGSLRQNADDVILHVLGHLHRAWTGNLVQSASANVAFCSSRAGAVTGIGVWRQDGFACFALGDLLNGGDPPLEVVERLRTLLIPGHWEIAMHLLHGPNDEQALLDAGLSDDLDSLRQTLQRLIGANLVYQDVNGYRLRETNGLVWAGIIRALCMEDLTHVPIGLAGFIRP